MRTNLGYTKAHLEEIVLTQFDNLVAMGELIRNLKEQNQLLFELNNKLKHGIDNYGKKSHVYPKGRRMKKSKKNVETITGVSSH